MLDRLLNIPLELADDVSHKKYKILLFDEGGSYHLETSLDCRGIC